MCSCYSQENLTGIAFNVEHFCSMKKYTVKVPVHIGDIQISGILPKELFGTLGPLLVKSVS